MRNWTETKALEVILEAGAEITGAKFILVKGGLNGLASCSAMDYLKRLNYKFKMMRASRPTATRKSGDSIAGISGLSQKKFKAAKQPGGFVTNKKLWYNIDDKPLNKQVNGRTKLTA
ncbi:hypothetical protein [Pseudobacteroides cellulosolvens]|uniref:Uncharacterized protein n=1 Tax=Pseudobacteroides cellulosolvens ATCC 35603 = DSM 2933 TaxID=398512 RepID=A0A0L6JI83_9FIRM|nr:hypothetical protein [Pseudobacteroides cellulosolvens]KNY25182.1 hypothetical protein Bccel_0439 [Pseudobacteroides cellulosolvens ATCC 35603 = DSM 2933]